MSEFLSTTFETEDVLASPVPDGINVPQELTNTGTAIAVIIVIIFLIRAFTSLVVAIKET